MGLVFCRGKRGDYAKTARRWTYLLTYMYLFFSLPCHISGVQGSSELIRTNSDRQATAGSAHLPVVTHRHPSSHPSSPALRADDRQELKAPLDSPEHYRHA